MTKKQKGSKTPFFKELTAGFHHVLGQKSRGPTSTAGSSRWEGLQFSQESIEAVK